MTLTRFLQDLLDRIDGEFSGVSHNNPSLNPNSATAGRQQPGLAPGSSRFQPSNMVSNPTSESNATSTVSRSDLDLWQYSARLCNVMFQEGLLDTHELMSWMIELLHKSNFQHDNSLRLIIVFFMNYLDVFASSHFLTRRLAFVACSLLRRLHASNGPGTKNSIHCTRHKLIYCGLSNIVQYLLVANPQSFVWNDLGDIFNVKRAGSICPVLFGSPLDDLPFMPSTLPVMIGEPSISAVLPKVFANTQNNRNITEESLRKSIADAERLVVVRSKAYEMFRDPLGILASISPVAVISRRVAELLVRLDRHNFNSNIGSSSLSYLLSFIPPLRWKSSDGSFGKSNQHISNFLPRYLQSKDPPIDPEHCAALTHLLLWAVMPEADSQTMGTDEHRWFVATRLIASVRQSSIDQMKELVSGNSECNDEDEKTTVGDLTFPALEQAIDDVIQEELFDFIESSLSSLISNDNSLSSKVTSVNGEAGLSVAALVIRNTIHLYGELIENGLFSPTAFMNSLVARGYLSCGGCEISKKNTGTIGSTNSKPTMAMISSPQSVQQNHIETPLSVPSWPGSAGGPGSLRTPTKGDSIKETDSNVNMTSPVNNGPLTSISGLKGVVNLFETQNVANGEIDDVNRSTVPENISTVYSLFLQNCPFPTCRNASTSSAFSSVDSNLRRDEENQRGVLLFGVGQKRSVAEKGRKAHKQLQRLFNRKHCVDLFSGQIKKADKGAKKSSGFTPSVQAQLRLWSTDISWHDRISILDQLGSEDALCSLRQVLNAVIDAGPNATKSSFESLTAVPTISSLNRLADCFIRAQSVRAAIQFGSSIIRCCPAILRLSDCYDEEMGQGGDRFAQHYANELLTLGISLCRRFFTCILATPDMSISVCYTILNAIIAYTVSPAKLLFRKSGEEVKQEDVFNLAHDVNIRIVCSAVRMAMILVKEFYTFVVKLLYELD